MIPTIFYLMIILLELFFFIFFFVITISSIYSTLKGSLYLPTKTKDLRQILKYAQLKPGQVFLELGCGDGRVVREAVKHYRVRGIGYEVNPLLLFWSRFISKIQKLSLIEFKKADIVKEPLPSAHIIYIFLMPKLINKISNELKKQLINGALIICHGFEIKILEKFLIKKIVRKQFSTNFYKL